MRKYYCSECGKELVITRMAIPRKGVILDLVEPHECGDKVDIKSLFDQPGKPDLIYQDKKTVQKSMPLEDPTPSNPLEILNKIKENLK
jgi:hypothetical protein